eukprot:835789-Pyramimonas_sp.AAC.1
MLHPAMPKPTPCHPLSSEGAQGASQRNRGREKARGCISEWGAGEIACEGPGMGGGRGRGGETRGTTSSKRWPNNTRWLRRGKNTRIGPCVFRTEPGERGE